MHLSAGRSLFFSQPAVVGVGVAGAVADIRNLRFTKVP